MNPQPTMNQLMDIFFTSIATPSTTLRERYFLRESLYSLQRLSLSQYKLEMATSLKKIIPTYSFTHNIKQKKYSIHMKSMLLLKTNQVPTIKILSPLPRTSFIQPLRFFCL